MKCGRGAPGNCAGSSPNAASMAPTTAAATNSIPRNRRPLPKNTVAKKRSSRWPSWSRMTPAEPRRSDPGEQQQIERELNDGSRWRRPTRPTPPDRQGSRSRVTRSSSGSTAKRRRPRWRPGLRGFQSGFSEAVDLAHALNSCGGRSTRPHRDSSTIILEPVCARRLFGWKEQGYVESNTPPGALICGLSVVSRSSLQANRLATDLDDLAEEQIDRYYPPVTEPVVSGFRIYCCCEGRARCIANKRLDERTINIRSETAGFRKRPNMVVRRRKSIALAV